MQVSEPFHAVLAMFVERARLAIDDLAMLSTVPVETIKNWLEGKVRRPRSWQDIVRLGTVLSLTIDEMDVLLQSAARASMTDLLRNTPPGKDRVVLSTWAEEAACRRLTRLGEGLAPHGPLPPGSRMPLSRNPLFVGREEELLRLAQTFTQMAVVAVNPLDVAAATGLGGIGKTQLTVEFVHRYGQFFTGGVYWLSFADPAAVPLEIAACGGAGYLNLHSDFARLSLDEQMNLVYTAWRQTLPRLLVFDNCEEPALLQRWRPTSGGCRILMTSRRSLWEPALAVRSLPLSVLSRQDSVTLLRRHAPQLSADDPALANIAAEVGDLPLALNLAGRYLHRYQRAIAPSEYLAQIRSTDLVQHPSFDNAGISPTGHPQHVARSFAISYDRLDSTHSADATARAVLARAASFAPGELIPYAALLSSWSPNDEGSSTRLRFEDGVGRLLELGLVEQAADGAIRLHRLVASFVAALAGADEAQAAVEASLLRLARASNTQADPLPLLPLQVHLRWVTQRAIPRFDTAAAALCDALGEHLWLIGQPHEAAEYVDRALAIWTEQVGARSLEVADSLEVLGLLRQMQGQLDDARGCLEQVLAIRGELVGQGADVTATAATNLGYLLLVQGQFAPAQHYLRQALQFYHQNNGLCDRDTARLLSHIGILRLMAGNYRSARRYLNLAVEIRRQVLPSPHMSTAQSINNLGDAHYFLGAYECALALHREALELRRAIFGDEHHDVAESLANIGRVMQAKGEYPEARRHIEEAVRINERCMGAEHFETLQMYLYWGALLCAQDELVAAREAFERALEGWLRIGRQQHPTTASALYWLGLLDLKEGNLAAARLRLEQAYVMQKNVLGDSHPETLATTEALSTLPGGGEL